MKTLTPAEFKTLTKGRGKSRFPRAAREDRTEDGITFASRAERTRYRELKAMRHAGEVRWFLRQPTFDLAGAVYRADFLVVLADGSLRIEEVKGKYAGKFRETALREWKRNAKQVKELYGLVVELVER